MYTEATSVVTEADMQQIGVRELRAKTSEVLRRVHEGETYQITSRGKVIAQLSPASDGMQDGRTAFEEWTAYWDHLVEEIGKHVDLSKPVDAVELLRGGRDW